MNDTQREGMLAMTDAEWREEYSTPDALLAFATRLGDMTGEVDVERHIKGVAYRWRQEIARVSSSVVSYVSAQPVRMTLIRPRLEQSERFTPVLTQCAAIVERHLGQDICGLELNVEEGLVVTFMQNEQTNWTRRLFLCVSELEAHIPLEHGQTTRNDDAGAAHAFVVETCEENAELRRVVREAGLVEVPVEVGEEPLQAPTALRVRRRREG